jgi:hypothetical protein
MHITIFWINVNPTTIALSKTIDTVEVCARPKRSFIHQQGQNRIWQAVTDSLPTIPGII